MHKRVLFVDFDGVLNSDKELSLWWNGLSPNRREDEPSNNCIDPKNVEQLNRIIEKTGADVVISSTWRIMHTMDWLKSHLERFGFKGNIIGKTKALFTERGTEIADWLDENPTDEFVILDDVPNMLGLSHRLVLTSFETGLTKEDADAAIRMFGEQP